MALENPYGYRDKLHRNVFTLLKNRYRQGIILFPRCVIHRFQSLIQKFRPLPLGYIVCWTFPLSFSCAVAFLY